MFFKDDYDFLSNMYPCKVEVCINDVPYTFLCVESAFQAHKDPSRALEFVNLDGYSAKKLGQQVQLRPDWEENKIRFMLYAVKAKYDKNLFLKIRLASIEGDIVEDNTWGDTYWGKCNGIGENHLGIILMNLRDYYNPFYCLVVGSRDFNDYFLMCKVLDHLLQNKKYVVIVSGGAKGADKLAERYANERGYRLNVYPADWNRHGKSAGYKRNTHMHLVLSAHKDKGVVAFWDGLSKGTAHNFLLSNEYSNPIKVVLYNENRYMTIDEIDYYINTNKN